MNALKDKKVQTLFVYKGHKAIDIGVIEKGFISYVCMPNMKSLLWLKLWTRLNLIFFLCHKYRQTGKHLISFKERG